MGALGYSSRRIYASGLLYNREFHDFAVFSLDKKRIKTFYSKTREDIISNLDSKVHKKVMLITPNKIQQGIKMKITDYDVCCYEYILDYLAEDDPTDELEVISRLRFEKNWDEITEELKQRILAVNKLVVEKYAGNFSYPLWQEYIAKIKARLNGE